MRLKIEGKSEGPVPSEAVVTIATVGGGIQEVVVHTSQVTGDRMEVGFIGKIDATVLVELPRETLTGRWRVWVPQSAVEFA